MRNRSDFRQAGEQHDMPAFAPQLGLFQSLHLPIGLFNEQEVLVSLMRPDVPGQQLTAALRIPSSAPAPPLADQSPVTRLSNVYH